MRKLILATATLGILGAAGGMAHADPQYRGAYYGPGYGSSVYEGRNVYVAPDGPVVYSNGYVRTVRPMGPSYGYQPTYADPWYQPGDQAIINQERANQRSR
ncbi:hypothetical protein MWN33_11410 [Starkeya koreensis]|uniref:Uncharacterized protein n=1 Tax=Ancylobacter koreensis TaxID=266121 RepID=A0ABT0DMY6_9HYPH|nr:hypothetical protein [Ancylobacter koreensis]MCK0208638.1 hypothetical protein [Ancylobacter koreensis]